MKFRSIKVFVLCHGLLQFSQLLYSSYFKSTLSTVERRYGLSSYSAGTLSSLHEVSNCVLIVFLSYFGNRVHRPRVIGIGGLLMSVSAMMLALPHFLSQPYEYDSMLLNRQDICDLQRNSSASESCGRDESRRLADTHTLWMLMAAAQLLFGVGSVPMQPFGISYIDDFAAPGNSPLYIAILFAVSVCGPAFGFLLCSVMLRINVDVDKIDSSVDQALSPGDPRWVGAWWMGLLITSACLALTSLPYFLFPRTLPSEGRMIGRESCVDFKKPHVSLSDFLKMFPRMFFHLLMSPLFLVLILAQCCFSSVIAGLSTFLNKFLERQYSASAVYSTMLVGAVNLPAVAVGMLAGGVVMKRTGMSLKNIPRFSVLMLSVSTLMCVPLFFMGCSTHKVSQVNHHQIGQPGSPSSLCYANCSCPSGTFNPVCGADGVEYVSPCHAGCTNFTKSPDNAHAVQLYTNCRCIPGSQRHARPSPCANQCPHFLLPFILALSAGALLACLTHNPMYMMLLRSVASEEKSFAIGVQFLLLRLLAWLPAPALFGVAIDTSCVWWKRVCGKKFSCGYYDNDVFRSRYLGLLVGYKVMGVALLAILGWKVLRTQEYSLEKRPKGVL
ncbi:solute carrier organic anion transporter family member 2A1 [Phyllopteryx taeniolatus]|uniref:solute carrier organic anion transporter family member 2A1 n=1 Tax=Phyllopteryx taeniolatus TaxID=161469 RepID=UPI002AD4C774|nr:solute carrier organic anion transporter family member 2A1 [Phyllopteryx taeniolatus]